MKESFAVLEVDKILPLILKYIKTYPAKKLIENIEPSTSINMLKEEFLLCNEIVSLLKFDSSLYFQEIGDIESFISNVKVPNYILEKEEILEVKKVIKTFLENKEILQKHKLKYSSIYQLVENVTPPYPLFKRINEVFDAEGNISDDASLELKKIRKRKSSIRGEMQARLNRIVDNENLSSIIQEKTFVLREGRFVIPIKTQYKNKFKSFLVHSFSKTGETAFVEPPEIIELNNEIVEIDEAEFNEIQKILQELTKSIAENIETIFEMYRIIGKLEFLYAKARFSVEFECNSPEITEEPIVKLIKARHPLVGKDCVPIDIEAGYSCQGVIISGPNAGGKTVALKTAGLLTLMTLCGIPIPADSSSKIGVFEKVFAEIGDEQNIAENLSSFSAHIAHIAKILECSNSKSLVLIDEVASSTEPKEGEAIGFAVIQKLLEKGVRFIITTHLQGLKKIPYTDKRVKNASVEFDEEKFIPLYRIKTGTSGNSYALRIAEKYGLSPAIIKIAEDYLKENAQSYEAIFENIETEKMALLKKKDIIEKHIDEAKLIKRELLRKEKEIEVEKLLLQKRGIYAIRNEFEELLKNIWSLKEELKKNKDLNIKKIQKQADDISVKIESLEKEIVRNERKHPVTLRPGDRVYVRNYEKEGYIESISENKIKVRIGIVSIYVDKSDIYETEAKELEGSKKGYYYENLGESFVNIDVRGKNTEEAIRNVEKGIDSAYVNGIGSLSIIHGKGEGILRKEIWNFLRKKDNVKEFFYAKPEDGGQGKTIVVLK